MLGANDSEPTRTEDDRHIRALLERLFDAWAYRYFGV
jgi:hypothetical protein